MGMFWEEYHMTLSYTFNCISKDNLNHGIEKAIWKAQAPEEALKFLPTQGWHKVGDTNIDIHSLTLLEMMYSQTGRSQIVLIIARDQLGLRF